MTKKPQRRPDPEWVRVGATLRTIRELRGMSADELANAVGKSTPYLRNIELGNKPLTGALLARCAAALGVRQIALMNAIVEDAAA